MSSNDHVHRRPYGKLKEAVVDILLRAGGPLTAREIRSRFPLGSRIPAATTLLTVLDRLYRAGAIERSDNTGEYLFALTRQPPADVADGMLEKLLRANDRTGALMNFAGALEPADLDVLRRAIKRRTND